MQSQSLVYDEKFVEVANDTEKIDEFLSSKKINGRYLEELNKFYRDYRKEKNANNGKVTSKLKAFELIAIPSAYIQYFQDILQNEINDKNAILMNTINNTIISETVENAWKSYFYEIEEAKKRFTVALGKIIFSCYADYYICRLNDALFNTAVFKITNIKKTDLEHMISSGVEIKEFKRIKSGFSSQVIDLAKVFFSRNRRTFDSIVWSPKYTKEFENKENLECPVNRLNTFVGFPYDPKEYKLKPTNNPIEYQKKIVQRRDELTLGKLSLFFMFLKEVICGGRVSYYNFIQLYIAVRINFPAEKTDIALVLLGQQGSGKSTFQQFLNSIVGSENSCETSGSTSLEQFNGMLENLLQLMIEELQTPDEPQMAKLLSLITGNRIQIEKKNKEIFANNNYCNVTISHNSPTIFQKTSIKNRRFVGLETRNANYLLSIPEFKKHFPEIKTESDFYKKLRETIWGHPDGNNQRPLQPFFYEFYLNWIEIPDEFELNFLKKSFPRVLQAHYNIILENPTTYDDSIFHYLVKATLNGFKNSTRFGRSSTFGFFWPGELDIVVKNWKPLDLKETDYNKPDEYLELSDTTEEKEIESIVVDVPNAFELKDLPNQKYFHVTKGKPKEKPGKGKGKEEEKKPTFPKQNDQELAIFRICAEYSWRDNRKNKEADFIFYMNKVFKILPDDCFTNTVIHKFPTRETFARKLIKHEPNLRSLFQSSFEIEDYDDSGNFYIDSLRDVDYFAGPELNKRIELLKQKMLLNPEKKDWKDSDLDSDSESESESESELSPYDTAFEKLVEEREREEKKNNRRKKKKKKKKRIG